MMSKNNTAKQSSTSRIAHMFCESNFIYLKVSLRVLWTQRSLVLCHASPGMQCSNQQFHFRFSESPEQRGSPRGPGHAYECKNTGAMYGFVRQNSYLVKCQPLARRGHERTTGTAKIHFDYVSWMRVSQLYLESYAC